MERFNFSVRYYVIFCIIIQKKDFCPEVSQASRNTDCCSDNILILQPYWFWEISNKKKQIKGKFIRGETVQLSEEWILFRLKVSKEKGDAFNWRKKIIRNLYIIKKSIYRRRLLENWFSAICNKIIYDTN